MANRRYVAIDSESLHVEPESHVKTNLGTIWAIGVFLVSVTGGAVLWANNMANKVEKHSEQLLVLSGTVGADHELLIKADTKLDGLAKTSDRLLDYFGIKKPDQSLANR